MLKYQYELAPEFVLPSYEEKALTRKFGYKAESLQIVQNLHRLSPYRAKTNYRKLFNQQKKIMVVIFCKLEILEKQKISSPLFTWSIKKFKLKE